MVMVNPSSKAFNAPCHGSAHHAPIFIVGESQGAEDFSDIALPRTLS